MRDFLEYRPNSGYPSALQHPSLLPRVSTSSSSNLRNHQQTFRTENTIHTARGIIRQAEVLDENRIVLYKKGKQLGRGYYIVEISSNNSFMYIAAYDVESIESFLIELPEKKAQDILS